MDSHHEICGLIQCGESGYPTLHSFVPNNTAVQEFYTRRGVSSIEELGTEYARNLVSYHIIQDTINQATFIEKEGALAKRTVSDDVLMVSFGSAENGGGGMRSVYLNSEAHVLEFANPVSNGYIYVLGNTLTPLTESVYARISESGRPYTLLKSALDATGWGTELNIIYDELKMIRDKLSSRNVIIHCWL